MGCRLLTEENQQSVILEGREEDGEIVLFLIEVEMSLRKYQELVWDLHHLVFILLRPILLCAISLIIRYTSYLRKPAVKERRRI